eukprot:CAMPEP_0181299422 /NCGR_PEP_ID=MMETSP1101-20121128/6336_1 /TAXON_ID=46948 /ORGANISM="Rhodomonas abbreviata, Strain Caron Lab Isolate" /LENGTH=174 /DNA_ID=CAMNT_0023404567 /DNA_START=45 /DNA_END=565 /DNA_ORIENTATION=-
MVSHFLCFFLLSISLFFGISDARLQSPSCLLEAARTGNAAELEMHLCGVSDVDAEQHEENEVYQLAIMAEQRAARAPAKEEEEARVREEEARVREEEEARARAREEEEVHQLRITEEQRASKESKEKCEEPGWKAQKARFEVEARARKEEDERDERFRQLQVEAARRAAAEAWG